MEPTTTDNMTCFLLGHNYKKIISSQDSQEVAVCKNCGCKVHLNYEGDFKTHPTNDKTFIKALRKLFLLKRIAA